jgi:hypothetical protein
MPKSPQDILDKVREIYDMVRVSDAPLVVLGRECIILLSQTDWEQDDVERVNDGVVDLLILSGWKRNIMPAQPDAN